MLCVAWQDAVKLGHSTLHSVVQACDTFIEVDGSSYSPGDALDVVFKDAVEVLARLKLRCEAVFIQYTAELCEVPVVMVLFACFALLAWSYDVIAFVLLVVMLLSYNRK